MSLWKPGQTFPTSNPVALSEVLRALEEMYRTCTKCGGMFRKHKLKNVYEYWEDGSRNSITNEFCIHCEPPYDEVVHSTDFKVRFLKKETKEITRKGEPIIDSTKNR